MCQDDALGHLNPGNTPAHVLLGLPSKIDASLDEHVIPFIGDPHWLACTVQGQLLALSAGASGR